METNTMLMQLAIALFAGAFVGLQREMYLNSEKDEIGFLGMRTNIFLAIFGVVSTFFVEMPYMPIVFFLSVLVLIAISHIFGSFKLNRPGITAELGAFIVFWIGVLIGFGQEAIAIILTIILTGTNTFRDKIDNFAEALNHKEWLAALQLLVFSGAILPILPNIPVSDLLIGTNFELNKTGLLFAIFSDINLFKVWLFVLFISGIGFVGYFLSKFIGAKGGIPIAAFLGALSSSTAVTVSLAGQEKQAQKSKFSELTSLIFAGGILIGISTMMLRVLLGIFVLGGLSLGYGVFYIPLSMAIFSAILAIYYMRKYNIESKKSGESKADIKLSSPFEIWPAIQFGGFYVMISVLMNTAIYYQEALKQAVAFIGENMPMYLIAFVSGFADVDAIYIKVAGLVSDEKMLAGVGVITITIAVIMNTLVKILYIKMQSTKYLAKLMAILISAICLVGAIVTYFVV
ncbi:MAG: MgtC/SapB family protein [Candidatus Gracilibacteria bacterium]|nr:MgtC/SapB family protein [Candidatus Gracilibacteria bacterium]